MSPHRSVYYLGLERVAKVVFPMKPPWLGLLCSMALQKWGVHQSKWWFWDESVPQMCSGLESHQNSSSHVFVAWGASCGWGIIKPFTYSRRWSSHPRAFLGVQEVKTIFTIRQRCYLPFSLLVFHKCTVEFSRCCMICNRLQKQIGESSCLLWSQTLEL